MSKKVARIFVSLALSLLLSAGLVTVASAQTPLAPGSIQVSRIQYDGNSGNTYVSPYGFPEIFNDQAGCNVLNDICNIAGIQGSIYIDQFNSVPASPIAGTLSLPSTGAPATYPTVEPGNYITTSFSSKSEGALMLSPGGNYLTYMGYQGGDQLDDVSNSYSPNPNYQLVPNTYTNSSGVPYPFYDREVALIGSAGLVSLTPIDNTNSGDNPRAAITIDGGELYLAGNSDSTEYTSHGVTTGPGLTIGVRCGTPLSSQSYQLGTYVATDRPDESAKKHVKDNNWRGIGIYNDASGNPQLYVSKGSGGNGDDGVFQVGTSLPSCTSGGTDTNATIVPLFSAQATNPTNSNIVSQYTPFGFWFANPTTLYVADEGYQNTDSNGNLIPDPLAGLEKWSLVNGSWTLDYTIQAGLNIYEPETFAGYNDGNGNPIPSYVTGIRNMAGTANGDGTVTIYAITAQYSSVSSGEPDPTSLVGITDSLAATTLPANEQFATLQSSGSGEVYRGVAFIPPTPGTTRQTQTITFPNPGPLSYGAAPVTLSASATSGWPIAYSLISGPATLSGNVLTLTGAGSVVVRADQSGNTDYSAATSIQDTITVNPEAQTITFTTQAPSSAAFGSSFTVAATGGGSGNPVVFTSGGACNNASSTYTMTSGTGSCFVYANQAGNTNYAAAGQITESTTATPLATSINVTSVSPASEDYGLDAQVTITAVLSWTGSGAAPTASAVTIGGNGPSGTYGTTSCGAPSGNTITCTNTYTPTVADGQGAYTETATFAGDTNYSGSSSPQTNNFTINQATSTTAVTSGNNPSTYGQSVTFTATINGENGLVKGRRNTKGKPQDVSGTVTWSTNTGCGTTNVTSGNPGTATCTTSALGGGTDTVTANYSGDSNHSGGSSSVSQVVNPASQTITFTKKAPSSEVYNGSFSVTATASSGLTVAFTASGSCSVVDNGNGTAAYTMTSGTGSCSVIANQAGNANYSAAAQVSETTTATKASQTISVSVGAPGTATDGSSFTVVATASSGLPVAFSSSQSPTVCSNVNGTYTIIAKKGTCDVAMNQTGNGNYAAASGVEGYTTVIAAVKPSVSFIGAPASAMYGSAFSVTALSNETGSEASIPVITSTTASVCAVSGSTTSGTTVTATVTMLTGTGMCSLKATWAANDVYAAATATLHTTAQKITPTVTFTGAPADANNGTNFTVTATSNESGSSASIPTVTTSTGTVCSVGSVTSNGPGSYQATVTMIKAGGTCITKAAWAVNPDYAAASDVQYTTAQ